MIAPPEAFNSAPLARKDLDWARKKREGGASPPKRLWDIGGAVAVHFGGDVSQAPFERIGLAVEKD